MTDHPTDKSPFDAFYRDEVYSLQNLLSRNQAVPGRTVVKEREGISPNHVKRINLISVLHFFKFLVLSSMIEDTESLKRRRDGDEL